MREINQAMAGWRKQMRADGITRPEILNEFESHLREEIQRQMSCGLTEAEAFQKAADQFGDGKRLQEEFGKLRRRRLMPTALAGKMRFVLCGLAVAVPVFVTGVLFCHFLMMPEALVASRVYGNWLGLHSSVWDAGAYISFVSRFTLGAGLAFEIPVAILMAVRIGWVDYNSLVTARPYVILVNLILGAVLTSPEVFTQLLMAIPLQLLYEMSVWVVRRKHRREQEHAGA